MTITCVADDDGENDPTHKVGPVAFSDAQWKVVMELVEQAKVRPKDPWEE
jgi:hypothetical protein